MKIKEEIPRTWENFFIKGMISLVRKDSCLNNKWKNRNKNHPRNVWKIPASNNNNRQQQENWKNNAFEILCVSPDDWRLLN